MRQRKRPSRQRPPGEATPFMKAVQSRVARFVRRHGILNPGERALLAVSGGQDSSALLLIVSRLATETGLEVAVAHFDHRLRSRGEARDDEQAVRTMAQALGLPFVTRSGEARARAARRHESLEEAARNLRFAFLAREAKRLKAGVVVLGHTRDDRAETVLLHLLRGSGLDGLIGLRPRSTWPFGEGPALARPLLAVTRAETGRYCREAGLSPREDPTNLLLEATRNRLRHELLPSLRQFNPRLDDALCRLGDAAAAAVAHLDADTEGAWQTLATAERWEVVFPRAAFEGLSPAVRARLVWRGARGGSKRHAWPCPGVRSCRDGRRWRRSWRRRRRNRGGGAGSRRCWTRTQPESRWWCAPAARATGCARWGWAGRRSCRMCWWTRRCRRRSGTGWPWCARRGGSPGWWGSGWTSGRRCERDRAGPCGCASGGGARAIDGLAWAWYKRIEQQFFNSAN